METSKLSDEERYHLRGERSPQEFIAFLRQKIATVELSKDELAELVRINREHVIASGSLAPSVVKEKKPAKAKKADVNVDDLLSGLDEI